MAGDNFLILYLFLHKTCFLQFGRNKEAVSKRQKTPCHLKVGWGKKQYSSSGIGFTFFSQESGLWHLNPFENASVVKQCIKVDIFNQLVA